MHIRVDADACPKVIKDILFRAAERTGVFVTLVANQPLVAPRLKNIQTMRVSSGFDVADNEIVKRLASDDLVITSDIPLAAEVAADILFTLSADLRPQPIQDQQIPIHIPNVHHAVNFDKLIDCLLLGRQVHYFVKGDPVEDPVRLVDEEFYLVHGGQTGGQK